MTPEQFEALKAMMEACSLAAVSRNAPVMVDYKTVAVEKARALLVVEPAKEIAPSEVVRRCTSQRSSDGSGSPQIPCEAYKTADGNVYLTCGEPCRWVMEKGGEGSPPYP